MPTVTVDVIHPNGIDCARDVKLPTDKPSSRVARRLAELMKIGQAQDERATCEFLHKHTGRKLAPNETLEQGGVKDGDTLKLLITGSAG